MRILVAEDEKDLNRVLTKRLLSAGYSVDSCYNGEDALLFLATGEFDAVIMDIMMPLRSGLEVLQTLRAKNDRTPVLLLTAKDTIQDKVNGLDLGADDYMVKPFSFEELLARIRAMTRKAAGTAQNRFTAYDLVVDPNSRTVTRAGKVISLSAKEFEILEYLIKNQGIVLSREKIENYVWGIHCSGGTNVVDVYIRYLRKKIDEDHPVKLIHTVRAVGYVLRCEA